MKIALLILICLVLLIPILMILINLNMIFVMSRNILSEEEAAKQEGIDCILVLGCGVKPDGTPSHMLEDRTKVGVRLFKAGASDRLLMSGDHGRPGYDEVGTMKRLAVGEGVDPEAVFCDHAGFSTYESMYRADAIFKVKRMIIVSQKYHLPRALFIAGMFGIQAFGVSANERSYYGQASRSIREVLARVKDVLYCLTKPEPTCLGPEIPITGKGSETDG